MYNRFNTLALTWHDENTSYLHYDKRNSRVNFSFNSNTNAVSFALLNEDGIISDHK